MRLSIGSTARRSLILTLALLAPAAVQAAAQAPAGQGIELTGNLVSQRSSFRQPFVLGIDHYSTAADLQSFAAALAAAGRYAARDQLWKEPVGYLSVGGRLGYPVAAVFACAAPAGRCLVAVLNRPMSELEVQYSTRSSRYPFSVVELNLDSSGRGDGTLIGAAQIQVSGTQLEVESLGSEPLLLLSVRSR